MGTKGLTVAVAPGNGGSAARPALIRALNEQLLLDHIRRHGLCSRADLARSSGLSKPTVSGALANVERAGLVRRAGRRTGTPGPAARLYEIRPEAGFVLGLDVGRRFLRGAVADPTGTVRALASPPARSAAALARLSELVGLADALCGSAGITRAAVTPVVVGSPGIYDPRRDAIAFSGSLSGWAHPAVPAQPRRPFVPAVLGENHLN